MKRIGNLYEKIISLENLRLADQQARKGKLKSYGVQRHDRFRDANIFKLHDHLKNMQFKTSAYHVFKIIADSGKEREIYRLPYYPDRIVHHAIMNVMENIWVNTFTSNTYSCIKTRGIHGAVRKMKQALTDKENTIFCLKLDIKKFYPSIDHTVLKQLIRKKIKDKNLLQLLDEIISSAPGVPIGNYLSQFFANIYLNYFDHWIKEVKKVKYYFRYADDMVILSNSKQQLHNLLADIKTYLKTNLLLDVKSNYQIFPIQKRGVDFVGYVFYHTHTLLRKRIKQSFARKAAKLIKIPDITPETYQKQLSCYYGWAKHCNSINLLNKIYYAKSAI